MLLDDIDEVVHLLCRFADRQTADGITRQVKLGNTFHMRYP
jgi:hypothetical protein